MQASEGYEGRGMASTWAESLQSCEASTAAP